MTVLLSAGFPEEGIETLKKAGHEPILLPPFSRLSDAIASHPDMLFFPLTAAGEDLLFFQKTYNEQTNGLCDKIAERTKRIPICCSDPIGKTYPLDVALNVLPMGNRLFARRKSLSRTLEAYAEEKGFRIVNTSQGYPRCGVCPLGADAGVTSDKGLANILSAEGIEVLTVAEGHIALEPYAFGFIGGASGVCGDTVYFCGDLSTHPNGARIEDFCSRHGKNTVSLFSGTLRDVGTVMFL